MRLLLLFVFLLNLLAADPAQLLRDSGNAGALKAAVDESRRGAGFEAQLRSAQLSFWLCEALYAVNRPGEIKAAAQAGIASAERAIQLQPNSSEAHRLLGDLLGQLIPHVFAGGMRYGARSSREIDKALQLDPKNAEAHIARATSYFYTPSAFGGSKEKAISELRTALELAPKSDTARIWLAQVYGDLKQMDRATEELREALRLNPQRKFTQYVASELKVRL